MQSEEAVVGKGKTWDFEATGCAKLERPLREQTVQCIVDVGVLDEAHRQRTRCHPYPRESLLAVASERIWRNPKRPLRGSYKSLPATWLCSRRRGACRRARNTWCTESSREPRRFDLPSSSAIPVLPSGPSAIPSDMAVDQAISDPRGSNVLASLGY